MKKLFALLLALTMVFSFAACGDKSGGKENGGTKVSELSADEKFAKEKAEYQAMTPEQLQAKYIKNALAVTTEEYIALISTLKYTDLEDDDSKGTIKLSENPTEKLYKTLKQEKAFESVDGDAVFKTLLKSEWEQVRGFAFENSKTSQGRMKFEEAKALLAGEKSAFVLCKIVPLIFSIDLRDPDVVDFIKRTAKNENKYVKMKIAMLLGGFNKDSFEGIVEIMKELMQDSDKAVKEKALINCGRLYDESVIDALEAVLKDKSQSDLHQAALYGLNYLWYDYATHKSTNERAYRITMDYYRNAFKEPNAEYNKTLFVLANGKSKSAFEDWATRATYYDTDEIAEIMVSIITNPNAPFGAKSDAIRAMSIHCSKAQLEANKAKIEAAISDNFALSSQYQRELEKTE